MYKVMVKDNSDIEFIVYNIVFDDTARYITTDDIVNKLQHIGINIDKNVIEKILTKWTTKGLLFNNYSNYIIIN